MQSSYSVIKRNFTQDGQKRLIETEYIRTRPFYEKEILEEEADQEECVKVPEINPEELIKKYEDIGQRILQDAKNEKQAIVFRAQMDASIAEKEAYEKGYDQGLQNGYDDGYKKAYDETIASAKAEADEIVNKAERLLKSANENYAIYLEDKKKEVIRLALEIAGNIAKKTLSYEDSMNSLIEEAFKISKGEESVILKSNSVHTKELKSQIDKWKISYGIKSEIFVIADDCIEPGNAILEKPTGEVRVGIDTGMEQIKKAIFNQ